MRARERAASFNIIPVMKPPALPVRCQIAVVCFVTFVPLFAGVAFATEPVGAPPTETPKTHVLFMGAELAMERGRTFHPVEDVTATDVVIRPEGEEIRLPLARSTGIRVTDALKLSSRSVTLENFVAESAFAAGSDPFEQLATSAGLAAGETAVRDLAQMQVSQASAAVVAAHTRLEGVRGTPMEAAARQELQGAILGVQNAEAAALGTVNAPMSSLSDVASRSVGALAEENHDALRVTFRITADRDIAQPYCAVIADIREPGSKTREVQKWTWLQPLRPLRAGEPARVTVYRGGFTPGFSLENCMVHLYEGGEEIATNLSRKRVPLTDEEAHDYRVIEYLSANRGRTAPASPRDPVLVEAAQATLTPQQIRTTWHVRVDKGGRVTGVFLDSAGKQPTTDAGLVAVLKTLRYNPALAAGKPVESIVSLRFGQ